MKRPKTKILNDQFKYLDAKDLATLNVGRGTITVFDANKKPVRMRIGKLTLILIKFAYERGLRREPLY